MGNLPTMSYVRKRKKNGKVYFEEVESVRINGKVIQRYVKNVKKEADSKTILSSPITNISIEEVKIYGPLLVLNYFCKQLGLSEILGEFGDEILSLVFAHCINYRSINQMEQWFKRTDLNHILNLKSLTESRLLKALDSIELQNIENLERNIFKKVKEKYKLDTDGIVYDVTNTYLYGKKCYFGRLGKDKDKIKGRPLIQIGLGVTRTEGIPIFHRTFNGNIGDSRTLRDLITSFKNFDINFAVIIYDRGVTSASNIKEIKKLKLDTICGVPSNNNLKKILKKIVAENKINDIKNRIKINESIFYVFRENYIIGEVKGVLLIFYNIQKGKDLSESRKDEIQNAQLLLKKNEKIKTELEKYFDKDGKIDYIKIYEEEKMDGFSFIFSSLELSSEEILKLYFQDKDMVEKAFQSLKGIVKIRPIRHWLYDRVIGHIFICYLSYLLLSLLRLKLKKINMTPVKALQELDSLYKVYIKDLENGFKLEKTVALTKVQEDILNCIDKNLLFNL